MNREMSKLLRITVICVLAASGGCGTTSNQSANPSPKPPSESWGTTGPTLSGDRYDLSRDEQRGGNTLNRHAGRTAAQLRQRLDREQNISAASSWTDRDAAEQTVGEALRVNRKK